MYYSRKYYVYIVANKHKNMLYTGVTNNLKRRVDEHFWGKVHGFSKKFNCKYLLYYEVFEDINLAIKREKQIKSFRREKKDKLISGFNPEWKLLNRSIYSVDSKYL
ncbi:MAG: GIY-YIG nuclease family protein [Bacteroidales bacterium]|jgi:putative endonuclease|nr:GIY-YIG nuclease family protein [Bacteroidales bacterium]